MTNDLVKRLRAHNPFSSPYMDEITHAAADEIERLRGELARIRKLDAKAFAGWRKTRETLHAEIDRLRAGLRLSVKAIEAQDALKDEIERLREVLRTIADIWDLLDAPEIARAALAGENHND